jgi:hypothetical protein
MSGITRRRILETYISPPVAEVIKDGMNQRRHEYLGDLTHTQDTEKDRERVVVLQSVCLRRVSMVLCTLTETRESERESTVVCVSQGLGFRV